MSDLFEKKAYLLNMSIFDFDAYRPYLKETIQKLPKRGRGEVGRWAELLNVSSSLLSQVFSGTRELSLEQARRLATYLALSSNETDYFLTLVSEERAGSQDLRNYYRDKRKKMQAEAQQISAHVPRERALSDSERAVFYSSPLYTQAHLLTSLKQGFTLDEIADRLSVSRIKAQEVMQFLLKTELVKLENHRYRAGVLTTHVEKGSPYLINHHRNWRIAAIQRAETLSDEELMYTGNFSVSRSDFKEIRAQFLKVIKEFSSKVADSPAEEIANLNIDLFWI